MLSDLLIGGSTDHDENAAALVALLNEWGSGLAYADRIAHLRDGLLSSDTVADDADADTLQGQGDLDWFWANESIDSTDRSAGEQLN